jgi:hypothetical protein
MHLYFLSFFTYLQDMYKIYISSLWFIVVIMYQLSCPVTFLLSFHLSIHLIIHLFIFFPFVHIIIGMIHGSMYVSDITMN